MTALAMTGEREILLIKKCLGLGKFGLSLFLLFFFFEGGGVKWKNLDNEELTILVCSEHSCYPGNSYILGAVGGSGVVLTCVNSSAECVAEQ